MGNQQEAACDVATQAASVFLADGSESNTGHCIITILCTLKDEAARKRYLELTREIVLPKKATNPACIRVTQTIPQNTDKFQILWIQEWLSSSEFKACMSRLFEENPRLNEVNQCLAFNPEVTIAHVVRESDL